MANNTGFIKQISKRATTIVNNLLIGAPVQKQTPFSINTDQNFQHELHPLPAIHQDPTVDNPQKLQKKLLDIYESIRQATLASRQNPITAPCFVRNVQFQNSNVATANVTSDPVTVLFQHQLGRAPRNGVTCMHSEGAAYQGFYVPPVGPQDYDPTKFAKVTTIVPRGATAAHHFMLSSE